MLIWGTTTTRKRLAWGQFYCPNCEIHRQYNLIRVKKWGHLYWIPVLPMDEIGRYIKCMACSSEYNEKVLEYDPIKQRDETIRNINEVFLLSLSYVTAEISENFPDLAKLRSIVYKHCKLDVPVSEINTTIETVRGSPQYVRERISAVAESLNEAGKEMFLQAGIESFSSGESLTEKQRQIIVEIGNLLGMSRAHITGVLAEANGSAHH